MSELPSVPKIALGVASGIALAPFILPVLFVAFGMMIVLLDLVGSILPDPRFVPHTIELRDVEMARDPSGRPRVSGTGFNGDDREVRSLFVEVEWLDSYERVVSRSTHPVVQYKRLPPGTLQHFEIRGPRAHHQVRGVQCALDPHWFRWSPDPQAN